MAINPLCKVCGSERRAENFKYCGHAKTKKVIAVLFCPHCDRPCKNKLSCTRCKKMVGWTGCGPKAPGEK